MEIFNTNIRGIEGFDGTEKLKLDSSGNLHVPTEIYNYIDVSFHNNVILKDIIKGKGVITNVVLNKDIGDNLPDLQPFTVDSTGNIKTTKDIFKKIQTTVTAELSVKETEKTGNSIIDKIKTSINSLGVDSSGNIPNRKINSVLEDIQSTISHE